MSHYHLMVLFSVFRSALRNVFILEFHPTLAVASKVPQALKFALQVRLVLNCSFSRKLALTFHADCLLKRRQYVFNVSLFSEKN